MTVYVFGNPLGGPMKIGCTHMPVEHRLEYLKRDKSVPEGIDVDSLIILSVFPGYSFELEAWLHNYFTISWTDGEWFLIPSVQLIVDAVRQYESSNPKMPKRTWHCNHADRKLGKKCKSCLNLTSARLCTMCLKIFSIKQPNQRRRKYCDSKCYYRAVRNRKLSSERIIRDIRRREWFGTLQDPST